MHELSFSCDGSILMSVPREPAPPPPPPPGAGATFEDATSLEEVRFADADACACGHFFSKQSWRCHVDLAVDPRAAGVSWRTVGGTRCMADGCRQRVPPRLFRAHLSPALLEHFTRSIVKSFVDCGRSNTRWCPAPDCPYAVACAGGGVRDVACLLGHQFCFKCSGEPHAPASCAEVELFKRDEAKEDLSDKWVLANCMPCPACSKMIFRDGGCNHMHCRKPGGCGFDFCFVCLAPIAGHGDYYSCARRPKNESLAQAKDRAKADLAEELYFANAISRQKQQSRAVAATLPAVLEKRDLLLALIGDELLPFKGLAFLEEAVETVVTGRMTLFHGLIHSRKIATGTPYQLLFEDAMAQYEGQLGRLASLVSAAELDRVLEGGGSALGRDAALAAAMLQGPEAEARAREQAAETDWERFSSWRGKVVNLAAASKKFRRNLIEAVRFKEF